MCLRDAWLGSVARAIAMIMKGFILAKDYSLIGAKILRDHGYIPRLATGLEMRGAAGVGGAVAAAPGDRPVVGRRTTGSSGRRRKRRRADNRPGGAQLTSGRGNGLLLDVEEALVDELVDAERAELAAEA